MRTATIKNFLSRSMAMAIALSLVAHGPAEAAIFNSLTNIQATPMGNTCRISWDLNITGEPGDGINPGQDFYQRQITTLGGQQVPSTFGQTEVQTIGLTSTVSQFSDVTIPLGTERYDKYIKITDFGGSGTAVLQPIIPDSVLQAAGGSCLNLRVNNEPTADAGSNATTAELLPVSLTGTASDLEGDPLTYQWTQIAGPAVTLSGANTLTPSFTAPAKAAGPQVLTFRLVANDGIDNSAASTVDITVTGNVGPTANAGPDQNAGAGATVTLDGTGSTDGDGDTIVSYTWTQNAGPAVTLNGANTATPTFTVPSITVATAIIFELVVNDGLTSSSPDIVVVAAFPNAPPTVNAGTDLTVLGASAVTLTGTASDPETDPLTYQWTQTAGPAVTLTGDTTLAPSFTAPPKTAAPQVLTFSLIANDGTSNSAPDTIDITVLSNVGPTANAGPDATAGGGTVVTLDGTGSTDGDGDPLTYSWTQTAGPAVTLAGANTANATFTAPVNTTANQVLTFSLTVDDGLATSAADTVEITIPPNAPPTVDAGNDVTFPGGSLVTLEGTAADVENDPLTYQWTQVGGPSVTLNAANTLNPSFTAPPKTNSVQVLTFSLIANDGTSNSAPNTVNVDILANIGPSANAGPDAAAGGGTPVTLNGSGSTDGDGDPLTYSWTQTAGPAVTLTGANTANPTFTAPVNTTANQVLTFSLTVDDGLLSSAADTVDIAVSANATPVVNAGTDLTVSGNSTVTLAGTASDTENDPLTFTWTQLAGPSVTLTDANTLTPSFTAPVATSVAQALTFSLTANDGISTSAPDTVDIRVAANSDAIANAGPDQSVPGNAPVTLDATGSSDPDGDPLSFSWVQTAGPAVTLSGANTATASFTAPAGTASVQLLSFEVTVSDGLGQPASDGVDISVAANNAPVANAGVDQGPIDSGLTVTLDGSGSSDPDNDSLTYAWTQVSGPAATLSDANIAAPTFVAPLVNGNEDLVFSLVVNDGQVSSAADTVTISVRAVGTITVIQRVQGQDRAFSFTSDVAALSATLTTSGGIGQLSATGVSAGAHTVTAGDLTAAGYALMDISCDDSDSVINFADRSVALALSPNEDLVCTFTSANTREAATVAINDFLTGRNALILASQPDLQRRLDRLSGGSGAPGNAVAYGIAVPGGTSLPFHLALSSGQTTFSASLASAAAAMGDADRGQQAFDIWTEARYSNVRLGSQSGRFGIVHIGADYRIGDNLLIGGLVQYDDFNDRGTLEAGEAEGEGWMAGPYLMARLSSQLFGEVRAAWGQSDNRVSPLGTYVDDFETRRSFYSGSLVGQFALDENIDIRPELTVRYLREDAQNYTDSFSVAIPGQIVDQGDVSFRPRFQHRRELRDGWTLRTYFEAEGIYTFGTGSNNVLDNGLRGRVEGGMDFIEANGFRSSIGIFHDGIGADSFRNSGLHISVAIGR